METLDCGGGNTPCNAEKGPQLQIWLSIVDYKSHRSLETEMERNIRDSLFTMMDGPQRNVHHDGKHLSFFWGE